MLSSNATVSSDSSDDIPPSPTSTPPVRATSASVGTPTLSFSDIPSAPLFPAAAAIRVSLGKDNNEQEVDEFVETLKNLLTLN